VTVELAEIEHPEVSTPPPNQQTGNQRLWWLLGILGVLVVAGIILQGRNTQEPPSTQTLNDFQVWLNELRDSIGQARFDGNPIFLPIDWLSDAFTWAFDWLHRLFVEDTARPSNVAIVGWAGVVALATWLGYALAGVRIALLVVLSMMAFGYLGYWEESIDTLIVTAISVVVCVVVGLPLGIWMSRSARVTTALTPVLDVMQTMPSFAYLTPLVLVFGIGVPGAIAATFIYALPPLVRISAHGLRTVSPTTLEATTAMGSTSQQLLRKVQLPMARRTIIVGLNQTIMAALSMAIICAFIAGPGLGIPILRALTILNVGVAFVTGLCIVIMAIMLDRTTVATGERSEAASRTGSDPRIRRLALVIGGAVALVAVYLSNQRLQFSQFPDSEIGQTLAGWANDFEEWFVDIFGGITEWISDAFTNWLLNPLQDLLANTPWWLSAGVILALAFLIGGAGSRSGRQVVAPAALCVGAVLAAGLWAGDAIDQPWWLWWLLIVALLAGARWLQAGGALLPASVCIAIIFGVGLWNDSMVTLAMTLVATSVVMVIGVGVGVWIGRSKRADTMVRPILDGLQTMPSLVYLIPALALFPPGRFLAIAAAILYASPVAIKIVADGIRGVSPTTVEAALAAGSSRWQVIRKVQLPMTKGSIVLAANQGLIFVLSMVVIGALVGGGGLGILVVNGFSQAQLFGKGLAAGIAITALGVMLDRITVHAAARYGRAESA